jgi:iron-sulfur cluster assembly accessory protein
MITLTDAAITKLADVLKNTPQYAFVRIGVHGGGCSGFEYSMSLIDEYEPDWELIEYGDVKVVVDPMSLMYLEDVTVDYIESLESSGFKFTNPNVRSQCGCGKSFSV